MKRETRPSPFPDGSGQTVFEIANEVKDGLSPAECLYAASTLEAVARLIRASVADIPRPFEQN